MLSQEEKVGLVNEITLVIQEKGLEDVKQAFYPTFHKMIVGSRLKELFGVHMIPSGFDQFDPDGLTIAIDTIINAMPNGKEKDVIIDEYDYWIKNQERVMRDHGMMRNEE